MFPTCSGNWVPRKPENEFLFPLNCTSRKCCRFPWLHVNTCKMDSCIELRDQNLKYNFSKSNQTKIDFSRSYFLTPNTIQRDQIREGPILCATQSFIYMTEKPFCTVSSRSPCTLNRSPSACTRRSPHPCRHEQVPLCISEQVPFHLSEQVPVVPV